MTTFDPQTGEVIPAQSGILIETPSPIKLSETGLTVTGPLSFEEWHDFGQSLQRVEAAIQWWIGDWLNYGENTFGEDYAQAVDEFGYADESRRVFGWVAGRIDADTRVTALSFQHHKIVAAREPDEQVYWLSLAVKHEWSTRDLREAMREGVTLPTMTVYLDDMGKTAQRLIELLDGDQMYELIALLSKYLIGEILA